MSLSGHFLIKSLFVPNGLFIILIMQFIIDIENSDANGYIICLKWYMLHMKYYSMHKIFNNTCIS